jgi:hypothetical protein
MAGYGRVIFQPGRRVKVKHPPAVDCLAFDPPMTGARSEDLGQLLSGKPNLLLDSAGGYRQLASDLTERPATNPSVESDLLRLRQPRAKPIELLSKLSDRQRRAVVRADGTPGEIHLGLL